MPAARKRKWKSQPRKYSHYRVQTTYKDKEVFVRIYTKDKARRFGERQKKSPVVKNVTIKKLS